MEKRRGALWKYAKMPQIFYPDVELLVQSSREGGYILEFIANNPFTKSITDRVSEAISTAVGQSLEEGLFESTRLEDSLVRRIEQVRAGQFQPSDFEHMLDEPDANVIRTYGDRAIVREVDQILAIIRSKSAGNSFFELLLTGETSKRYNFNKFEAKRFHSAVSKKSLGHPVIYTAEVISLDKNNLNGKIKNTSTNHTSNIKFINKNELNKAIPYFEDDEIMHFIGCPFIEYGAFDPKAGDIYFIDMVNNG
ncbi:hypothetical protein [uncultured Desulfobulbus sp.]|uniref:hypothetical protein n=1 Tax=uncultured Desulfobulbus sp. TaxID=239745 RepID=UPI0029C826A9|nr:hypothetical protein [uncultured Desulfobulbus sp.]